MEENTARMDEIQEIETVDEVAEASENSNTGAFVAGIVGGFLAYAVVSGAKKLAGFVSTKLAERKQKKTAGTVIDAEIVEDQPEADSDEETPEK
jgi:hypothetical protein